MCCGVLLSDLLLVRLVIYLPTFYLAGNKPMQLNPNTVKTLRQQYCWTQQHLADASDVSLRTIQRVEKEGTASKETTMSLCAVFEIRQGELIKLDEPKAMNSQHADKTSKFAVVIATTALISFALGVASVLFFVK